MAARRWDDQVTARWGRWGSRPRGSRLLGMARPLQRDQLRIYHTVVAEYGDVVHLVVGPPGLRRPLYLVTHPDGVERVLPAGADRHTKHTPYYEEIGRVPRERPCRAGSTGYGSCATTVLGDLTDAPYDRVIATVGAWDPPRAWLNQVADGGRLVMPMRLRAACRVRS